LRELDQNLGVEPKQVLEIYVLDQVQRERFPSVRESLSQSHPRARLVWNEQSGELFVWARPEEHAGFRSLIEELRTAPPLEQTNRVVAYAVRAADLAGAAEMIRTIAPQAKVVPDTKGRRILVWASPEEHKAIAPVVDQGGPGEISPTASSLAYHSYPAGDIDANLATQLLAESFPAAEFQADATARSIVARATSDEHRDIAKMLEQLRAGSTVSTAQAVTLYPLGQVSAERAQSLANLFPRMRISIDSAARQVAALGTPDDHAQLREALKSLGATATSVAGQVMVYDVGGASATAAAQVLRPLAPGATIVPDEVAHAVAVWATPSEHSQLKQAVDAWLTQHETRIASRVQVYRLEHARAGDLVASLPQIVPGITVTSPGDDRLAVRGNPEQQQSAMELLKQMDTPQEEHVDRQMHVYSLHGIAPQSAMNMLNEYFSGQSHKVEFFIEQNPNRLIAFANPDQHARIEDFLAGLRPQETELEVFVLEILDPLSAELAVMDLLADDPSALGAGGQNVIVEAEEDTGRLLVRGTRAQLDQVRELLVKLGETNVGPRSDAVQSSPTRFVPLLGGDAEAMIKEIRALWPGLRENQLQIAGENELATNDADEMQEHVPPAMEAEISTGTNTSASDNTNTSTNAAADTNSEASRPPVIVVPNIDGMTIMSDDAEAAAQLESLVRAMARRGATSGANFSVFPLEHATATRLAQVLSGVFRQSGYARRGGPVEFAADERLNALIAIGGRAERREVQSLLSVLDTDQAADLSIPAGPTVIPLKHARAEKLLAQLRELYKTQLSADAGQPPIEIPPGADVEVVAMLQQINAARRGPLLALDVEPDLNSLIVLAPRPLLEEIRALAEEVDRQSADSGFGVRVVPLEALQGDQIFRSLERLLDQP
jgi:type II secretory pathway component GspD/PulD (secretin)